MIPSHPPAAACASASSPRHVQRLRDGDAGRRSSKLLEDLAALVVRPAAQVLAVEPEDVEEDHPLVAALLQELKARRALLVEDDDLAVDDDLLRLHLLQRSRTCAGSAARDRARCG